MIPNLFKKEPIPDRIPKELENRIKEFSKAKSKEKFARLAFEYVADRWKGHRFNLIFQFHTLFTDDLDRIMQKKGYHHCTNMNFVLRVMLVKSGFFKDEDIELKLTNSWFIAPHQYIKLNMNKNRKIYLDPYNYQFGIDYGDFGRGLKSLRINPIR